MIEKKGNVTTNVQYLERRVGGYCVKCLEDHWKYGLRMPKGKSRYFKSQFLQGRIVAPQAIQHAFILLILIIMTNDLVLC
jgi:hypothetical protein